MATVPGTDERDCASSRPRRHPNVIERSPLCPTLETLSMPDGQEAL
jgi:hypothetical protein